MKPGCLKVEPARSNASVSRSKGVFAREHVNHAGRAHARFNHHESGVFLGAFADNGSVLA